MPISPTALSSSPATRTLPCSDELSKRVSDAVTDAGSASHFAKRFATGLVTGNADDVASLSGTVAGDLFVFGDIRDVVREGKHLAMGEDDRPAGAGPCGRGPRGDRRDLCIRRRRGAGARRSYHGQGCPQGRAAGRGADAMGRPLGARDGRCAGAAAGGREGLGAAARRRPSARSRRRSAPRRPARWCGSPRTSDASARRPGPAGRSIRCASREGPKDVARAARLAESKGGQTRAILKVLGRGALLLAAGAFNLSMWVFGALLALFGFLSSIKATTERATEAWLRRKKARRLRRCRRQPAALGRRRRAGLDWQG